MNGSRCMYVYVHMCVCVCVYVYTDTHTLIHNGILLSHKNEWNFGICNMDGLGGYYAKWNKLGREILYDTSYMWNLKNKTD